MLNSPRTRAGRRWSRWFVSPVLVMGMVVACAACGQEKVHAAAPTAAVRTSVPVVVTPTSVPPLLPPSATCPTAGTGFSCDDRKRFVDAERYVASKPGSVGMVLRDRVTGAVWRSKNSAAKVWTASTVKLAIATYLLERQAAGHLKLTANEKSLMSSMLRVSDDHAADVLWRRGGRGAMMATWQQKYGMSGVTYVSGFSHYWGFLKCAPTDLDRLMSYVLGKTSSGIRTYLLGELRKVGSNQRWGVYAGADKAARPGNKNGWSIETDDGRKHWVINTVGFAGRGERWELAVMYRLAPSGTYDSGVAVVSHVSKILLAGKK